MLINLSRLKGPFVKFSSRITTYELPHFLFDICMLIYLLVMLSTGEDDSLALKKKVTIEDVFGPDLHIHDPDAKWLSGE